MSSDTHFLSEIERQEELLRRQLLILEKKKSLNKRITETKEQFSEKLKWLMQNN